MNYYILRQISDPIVLGVDNGIKQADILESGFKNKDGYKELMTTLGTNEYFNRRENISDFEFNIEYVKLLSKANRTDFLQFGPHLMSCPFLISEAVKLVLEDFEMYGVKIWPATVIDGPNSFKYFLFYISSIPATIIDFSKSSFYTGNSIIGKKHFHFSDLTAMKSFQEKNLSLRYDKINLNESFQTNLDLFELPNSEIIISQRLRDALSNCNFEGIKLLPAFGDEGEWLKIVDL
jgi:hypothetical protein